MSLASIKAKETRGKHKSLPKLKTILASPYKTRSPTLSEIELQQLRTLLCEAVQRGGNVFATKMNIHLGLESSLRAINLRQTSVVLLSLSIKPQFLVGLVARNCEVKDETVPVYAQPQLEQFTEEVFGVRALAIALPLDIGKLGPDLEKWCNSRKKPRKIKISKVKPTPIKKKKEITTLEEPEACIKKEPSTPAQDKTWSGDFLSFSNTGYSVETNKIKLEEDKVQLLNALNEMAKKAREQKPTSEISKMDTDQTENIAEDIVPIASDVVAILMISCKSTSR